jgi:hypothetical protein
LERTRKGSGAIGNQLFVLLACVFVVMIGLGIRRAVEAAASVQRWAPKMQPTVLARRAGRCWGARCLFGR